jgi:hypothetical protein
LRDWVAAAAVDVGEVEADEAATGKVAATVMAFSFSGGARRLGERRELLVFEGE